MVDLNDDLALQKSSKAPTNSKEEAVARTKLIHAKLKNLNPYRNPLNNVATSDKGQFSSGEQSKIKFEKDVAEIKRILEVAD